MSNNNRKAHRYLRIGHRQIHVPRFHNCAVNRMGAGHRKECQGLTGIGLVPSR